MSHPVEDSVMKLTTSPSVKGSVSRMSLLCQRSIWDQTTASSEEDFSSQGEKAAEFGKRNPRTIINWDLFITLAVFWEDSAMDNIGEEYDQLVEHLHDCTKKAESFKTSNSRARTQGFAERR
ncbi:hypothetical protein RB195_009892 [Necator americanus]|uniref:Uncharacterized protein n=1 Tax=Necator americanus TaxID=51031 RepID=A0ABR1CW75_NECAM